MGSSSESSMIRDIWYHHDHDGIVEKHKHVQTWSLKKRSYTKKGTPVETRQVQVNQSYESHARQLDAKFNDSPEDEGRVLRKLKSFGHDGKVAGLVCGSFGECSSHIHQLAIKISKHQAVKLRTGTVEDMSYVRARCEKSIKNLWGLKFTEDGLAC